MEEIKPTRERGGNEDFIFTQQTYNARYHPDSLLKIDTSDRGEATDNPKRDLKIYFSRVSEGHLKPAN